MVDAAFAVVSVRVSVSVIAWVDAAAFAVVPVRVSVSEIA